MSSSSAQHAVRCVYWPGRGLMEPSRLLLAACNVKFENVFISSKEQFDALKTDGKLLFNQVPLIEMDGLSLVMSGTGFRYIARKYNMVGNNLREEYIADLVSEACKDVRMPLLQWQFNQDSERALSVFDSARYFPKFEGLLSDENTAKNGYFLSEPSCADVSVFEMLDFLEIVFGDKDNSKFYDFLSEYPKLLRNYKLSRKLGNIEDYIANDRQHLPLVPYSKLVCATQPMNYIEMFKVD